MTSEQPWEVRHIYTTADSCFERYLTELREKLRASKQAGWIQDLHDCPVGQNSGIGPAVQASEWTELVIVDLHGWIGDQGPWLGTTTTPGLWLRDLPANSWSASTIFLTGCRGGTPEFDVQLDRVLTRRTTVASHFEEACFKDHTPIVPMALITAALNRPQAQMLVKRSTPLTVPCTTVHTYVIKPGWLTSEAPSSSDSLPWPLALW